MANWERYKPKSMPIEELKKRMEAGLKRWIAKGWMRNPAIKVINTQVEGPSLNKQQRKRVIQCANVAIHALANGDRQDYCNAIEVINSTRRLAGMSTEFMQNMCSGIAEAAAVCANEEFAMVDQRAKWWLVEHHKPSTKVITLPSRGKLS